MAHGNQMNRQKYYFIKLPKDWFNNVRIKKLRKLAGGDTYTIIYLKLMLLAMNKNSTIIYEGLEDSIEEELALKLDEKTENITLTLSYLKSCGLWEEKENGDGLLVEVESLTGSESYSAIVKRQERNRLSNHCLTNVQPLSNYKDKEKDKDIELEKDKDIEQDIDEDSMPF